MRATLTAQARPPLTKGGIRRLRAAGMVPITVSKPGAETSDLAVPSRELTELLHRYGRSVVIELSAPGGKGLVIPRDVQREAISGSLLHVGFRSVSAREPIAADVAIRLVGEPEAARTGAAVVELQTTAITVRALPDRLPTHIDVDVSDMAVGHALRVADLPGSSEYEVVADPETVVVSLHTVRVAPVPEAEAPVEEEAKPAEAEGDAEAAQSG